MTQHQSKTAWRIGVAVVFGLFVAALWPGHGEVDSFRDRVEANGAPLPFERLMAEGPFPDGCAESRECADAAMLLTALMAGEPIRNAGAFDVVHGPPDNPSFEPPLWFDGSWNKASGAHESRYDVTITVPDRQGDNAIVVGYLRYGETGEVFFDWWDGRYTEFRPKRLWVANKRVADRFHEALRAAYEGRTRLSGSELEELERRLGAGGS